jgi:hypothetical protein
MGRNDLPSATSGARAITPVRPPGPHSNKCLNQREEAQATKRSLITDLADKTPSRAGKERLSAGRASSAASNSPPLAGKTPFPAGKEPLLAGKTRRLASKPRLLASTKRLPYGKEGLLASKTRLPEGKASFPAGDAQPLASKTAPIAGNEGRTGAARTRQRLAAGCPGISPLAAPITSRYARARLRCWHRDGRLVSGNTPRFSRPLHLFPSGGGRLVLAKVQCDSHPHRVNP